eukprot:2198040-Pyramimonas_sp.AAC.1
MPIVRVILRGAVRFLHSTWAVQGLQGWKSQQSIRRHQTRPSVVERSGIGLILELGLPNYSHCSNHLERCCRFTQVTRAVGASEPGQKTMQSIGGVRLLHREV